jgi:hypothetical protein
MYVFQPYPTTRYHYDGTTTITVKSSEEEKALGGGWARSFAEWDPYRLPRRAASQDNPVKWVDQWSLEGLSEGRGKNSERSC